MREGSPTYGNGNQQIHDTHYCTGEFDNSLLVTSIHDPEEKDTTCDTRPHRNCTQNRVNNQRLWEERFIIWGGWVSPASPKRM